MRSHRVLGTVTQPPADTGDFGLGDLVVAALGVLDDGRIRFRVAAVGSDRRFTIVDVPSYMENPESVAELFVATHEKVVTWSSCDVDDSYSEGAPPLPPA